MMSNYYKECRRCDFFFRTWSEASLAHLKKTLCQTLVPSHGVIKVIKAKILNLYKSLNSPQVKHNYSPINRTSGLGVDIHLGPGCGRRQFRHPSKRLLTMYEKKIRVVGEAFGIIELAMRVRILNGWASFTADIILRLRQPWRFIFIFSIQELRQLGG